MMPRRLMLMLLALLGACHATSEESAPPRRPPLDRLRIALVGQGAKPDAECAADNAGWPTAQRAYVRHLAERMEIPVTICPVPDRAAAARAVAEARADLTLLDPASYAPHRAGLRPIMTQRLPTDLGRVEVVLAVADRSPAKTLADADRAALLFAGSSPPRLDGPKRTLAAVGVPAATLTAGRVLADPAEVAAALRTVPGAVAAFLSADWSRLCKGLARDDHPCTGLREIWRGRPPAPTAWVVRRDIPDETWARLVGIHVALFEDRPEAARWLAPDTDEIEPTEATALDPPRTRK